MVVTQSPLWLSVGTLSTTLRGSLVLPFSEAGTETQRGIGPFCKSHSFVMAELGGGLELLSPPAWDCQTTVLPQATLEWFQQKPGREHRAHSERGPVHRKWLAHPWPVMAKPAAAGRAARGQSVGLLS